MRSESLATIEDVYIDPSYSSAERQLLQQEMVGLPLSIIQDFVFVDGDGQVHANRPELIAPGETATLIGPNLYSIPSGDQFAGPGGSLQIAPANDEPDRRGP